MICIARITGMPTVNRGFRVLCRNRSIPARAPMLPPTTADRMSVPSGMRQRPSRARRLSTPNSTKDTILMISR